MLVERERESEREIASDTKHLGVYLVTTHTMMMVILMDLLNIKHVTVIT